LQNAALASFDRRRHHDEPEWRATLDRPVRVQWDPERDLNMRELPYRSIQVGLSGAAVAHYVDNWTIGISDVTVRAHEIRRLVAADPDRARTLLPVERVYPLSAGLAAEIGASPVAG
jgi:uncharacterized protein DUF4291